jgi:hypothetical protein
MRTIQSLSAEELALVLSRLGFRPTVDWQIDKTARLRIEHKACTTYAYLYGLDEMQRGKAITFTAAAAVPIQFWHLEDWSLTTLFGRLRRDDDGYASVDWTVPIEGVSEEYLNYCFHMWCDITGNFFKYCEKVMSEQSPQKV